MEMRLDVRSVRRGTCRVTADSFEAAVARMTTRGCRGRYAFGLRHRAHGNPVERVDVTASPSITMPVWARNNAADAAHQRERDRMHAALQRHEAAHHSLLTETAERFAGTVPNIPTPMDRAGVSRLMRDFEAGMQRAMDSFDRRTRNGESDGVELAEP
jgi:predicted secreted Zn-dependent protease